MCQELNFLAIRGKYEITYDEENKGHEDLIKKNNLTDTNLYHRNFIRIEVKGLNSFTSLKITDWQFKVDEEGTLPIWFEEEKDLWQTRAIEKTISIIKEVRKNGVFKGSFRFQNSQLKSLGKLQSIGGEANFSGSQLKKIPKSLKIKGAIYK